MPSHVSAYGAHRPLREGQLESEQHPAYGEAGARRWFVGGQSERSQQVALWALENVLDGPEGYRTDTVLWSKAISPCASLRNGNCLTFRVLTPDEYAWHERAFGGRDV